MQPLAVSRGHLVPMDRFDGRVVVVGSRGWYVAPTGAGRPMIVVHGADEPHTPTSVRLAWPRPAAPAAEPSVAEPEAPAPATTVGATLRASAVAAADAAPARRVVGWSAPSAALPPVPTPAWWSAMAGGARVALRSGHLRIGDHHFDLRGASVWAPRPAGPVDHGDHDRWSRARQALGVLIGPTLTAASVRVGPALADLVRLLAEGPPRSGAGLDGAGLASGEGRVVEGGGGHAPGTAPSGQPADDRPGPAIAAAVGRLVGRGPGLTPSGDDALLGLLTTFDRAGAAELRHLLVVALRPLLGRTAAVSAHQLRLAIEGHVTEAVADVVDALALGEVTAPFTAVAVARLCRHGATSGVDTIAGVDAALAVLASVPVGRAVAA